MSKSEDIECFACKSQHSELEKWSYTPRDLNGDDVMVDIYYCGICGSDIHKIDNDWKCSIYPMVPGHEIVGKVLEIGSNVTSVKIGDVVGIGPQVYSCGDCGSCSVSDEQYCKKGVFTYSDKYIDGSITYGGYAKKVVANERFVFKFPDGLDISKAAPLLCAGATVYTPLKSFLDASLKKIGIVGIGGLGHMALLFGKAMGLEMAAISHTKKKESECLDLFKASVFIDSSSESDLAKHSESLDGIIMTSNGGQSCLDKYLNLLKVDGSLVLVAIPGENLSFSSNFVMHKRSIRASLIAGRKDMKEMLQLARDSSVLPLTEEFPISRVNEAIAKVRKGDIRYRAVLKIIDQEI